MTTTAITQNKTINKTTPNQVENGAGDCTCCRIRSVSAILIYDSQRFDEPRIADRKKRCFANNTDKGEGQGRSHRNQGSEVPQAQMDPGTVKRGQHDQIHIEQ